MTMLKVYKNMLFHKTTAIIRVIIITSIVLHIGQIVQILSHNFGLVSYD